MSLSKQVAKTFVFNSEAPDILLKKISELELTLKAAKENPNRNQKAIDFYTSILAAMKYAWAYMTDMDWIHKRLTIIEAENEFLKEYAGNLKQQLTKYEVIETLKITGDFDQVVQAVDLYINTYTDTND